MLRFPCVADNKSQIMICLCFGFRNRVSDMVDFGFNLGFVFLAFCLLDNNGYHIF